MAQNIAVQRAATLKAKPADDVLGFGKFFTDHMAIVEYHSDKGWYDARVVPYGPLSLDPSAAVLHYGQELFEGIKAFRGVDGKIRIFRVDRNCRRMNEGAARICMPAMDPEFMADVICKLIEVEKDWVPHSPATALYIRPTLIGTEPFLGVKPSKTYTFFVILSPVGPYYAEGLDPVKIWVEDKYVRAARGGLGAIKAGANYAASLLAAEEAKKKGYAQVLWLDAQEHKWFEEVCTMNLFVKIGDEVCTAPLGGSILPGVTRDSVLTLLRDMGVKVSERSISIDEVAQAASTGQLKEVFGTGTAAVISPVKELCYKGETMKVGDGKTGPLSQKLYATITGIQYGKIPDPHNWLRVIA